MKKIIWLDIETTGLDSNKHGIIQIAMLMDIDGDVVDELLVDVQPFLQDLIIINEKDEYFFRALLNGLPDVVATPIMPSGINIKDIIDFDLPSEAYQKIAAFFDKHIYKFDKTDKAYLGGYNVNFDRAFISNFFKKNGDNYLGSYMNWKCLDPLYILWQMDIDGLIALENYKLETACNHFKIDISAHHAMSDIKATKELYYKLRSKVNESSNDQ